MPAISEGLKTALNNIRELSISDGKAYHQYVPVIDDTTDISAWGSAILTTPVIMNEFMSMLVNRIAYTMFEQKYFRNPLQVLEGDAIPMGQIGQEIYTNPAKGRKYDVNDFARNFTEIRGRYKSTISKSKYGYSISSYSY